MLLRIDTFFCVSAENVLSKYLCPFSSVAPSPPLSTALHMQEMGSVRGESRINARRVCSNLLVESPRAASKEKYSLLIFVKTTVSALSPTALFTDYQIQTNKKDKEKGEDAQHRKIAPVHATRGDLFVFIPAHVAGTKQGGTESVQKLIEFLFIFLSPIPPAPNTYTHTHTLNTYVLAHHSAQRRTTREKAQHRL
jgi:hypothetical protein